MRHVWSLIAGIVITPLAWFLIAFGQGAMSRGQSSNDFGTDFLLGGLLIIGIGLVIGLISSLRTSPVGALISSLLFLGASVFYLLAPTDALKVFSREVTVADYKTNLAEPLHHGTLAVVGGMLLIAVFSAARWRGSPSTDDSATTVDPWSPPPAPTPWEPPSQVTSATDTGETRTH